MRFCDILARMDLGQLEHALATCSEARVERALARETLAEQDLLALLSPAAVPYLEPMAARAYSLTRQRFGRTIQLYAPIYVSNECVNRCAYCGFSHDLDIARTTLTPAQVADEAALLREHGFRHLLLVSGEVPRTVDAAYLESVVRTLENRFESYSIETGTFSPKDYARLVDAGIDGITLYQETYWPSVYRRFHLAGPKTRYDLRLTAMEHGGEAGFRALGIGALLGLAPFRVEAMLLALHGRYLARRFWRCRIAVSFPRLRAAASGFVPPHPVSDTDLVQMICALRLALPDAELVLSTREPAALRDALLSLGITRMSAGSRTNPGGYGQSCESGRQFEVEDRRTPAEVANVIAVKGLEPVWKDFDRALVGPRAHAQA